MHSILFSGLVRHASPTPECALPLHFLAEFKHRIFSFDAVTVQMGESRSIHEHDDEAAHLQCTLCVHHVGLGSSRANIWLDRDPLSCEFLCTPMCFLLWRWSQGLLVSLIFCVWSSFAWARVMGQLDRSHVQDTAQWRVGDLYAWMGDCPAF